MSILVQFGDNKDHLTSAVIADALDALGHRQSALPQEIRPLNEKWKVLGRVATLNAIAVAEEPAEPYKVELQCIDALTEGDVLVATTNGERTSALWGELLSTASRAHGAVGVVLDGLTRDAEKILAMDFPVFATGFSPLDSKGRLDGIEFGEPIRIGQCIVRPGDFVFADIDGVVVVPSQLAEQTFTNALKKATAENTVRDELAKGRSAQEVFDEYGIL